MAETTTIPAWTARQSNTDEAEELRRPSDYLAQQRIDARILAEQAADWARIAAGAGASTANCPDSQHQSQTYALASIALSLAYGSDRP